MAGPPTANFSGVLALNGHGQARRAERQIGVGLKEQVVGTEAMSPGQQNPMGYWFDVIWKKWRRMHICYAEEKPHHTIPHHTSRLHLYHNDLYKFSSEKASNNERIEEWIRNNEAKKTRKRSGCKGSLPTSSSSSMASGSSTTTN